MTSQLDSAVARFGAKGKKGSAGGDVARRISAAAFRAAVEQRLRNLEREIGDLKGRLNGLIFVVTGAVITQVVLKLAQ